MAEVVFAKAFRRHVDCPDAMIQGSTLREVLDRYFERYPLARGYVLDGTGAVRQHIAVFLNLDPILDRHGLGDAVGEGDRIQLFQALSGGSA